MNNLYPDHYRPKWHFSAPYGWINDPNGLVYSQGLWHLFYQHYPMDTVWGPMYWGHAISSDLIHWQHAPIALQPDSLGYMFSGSAIIDRENVSGLFASTSENNLMAFYTASLDLPDVKLHAIQSQCVAYSQDGGLHWEKYSGNPVIANPLISCFRDPKVLWHEASERWIMVITHGQSIGFYQSANLLDWQLTSEFGLQEGFHSQGPWECPDLFEIEADDGVKKWVLIVGIGDGCPQGGSGTQYFVGQFDGTVFHNDNSEQTALWLDYGRDYYATQTWFNAPQQRRIGISWMSNWRYARNTDTALFRGIMTAAKEYHLVKNGSNSYLLAQSFSPEMLNNLQFSELTHLSCLGKPLFFVRGTLKLAIGQTAAITLFGDDYLSITRQSETQFQFIVNRTYAGKDTVMQQEFPHQYPFIQTLPNKTEHQFELLLDHGASEFHFANGLISISQINFPSDITPRLIFSGGEWNKLESAVKIEDAR